MRKLSWVVVIIIFTGCMPKECSQETMAEESQHQSEEMTNQTQQMIIQNEQLKRIADALEALSGKKINVDTPYLRIPK